MHMMVSHMYLGSNHGLFLDSLCRLSLLAKTPTAYCKPAPQAASDQFMPFIPRIPHTPAPSQLYC
jgi:hypothetical protein